MKKILLTRHGHTNYNDKKLCNADPSVKVFLTEEGITQSMNLRAKLEKHSIEKVYVSDLPRTNETASYCVSSDVPVIIDSRISDIKTGFESLPVSDYLNYIKDDPFIIKPPGGESYQELKSRVFSFLVDILQTSENCILIVSHLDPVKLMIGHFNGLSDSEILRLKVSNCELREFNIGL